MEGRWDARQGTLVEVNGVALQKPREESQRRTPKKKSTDVKWYYC